jgi:hypothetical protein
MSEERKRRLKEKLDALDERLTALRLHQEVAQIVEVFGVSNLSFEWTPDARQIFHWVTDEYKVNAWGWFDQSPEFKIIDGTYSNSYDALKVFRQLANEHKLVDEHNNSDARVHLVWVYGPESAFTLNLHEVINSEILKVLFQTDSEFWIAETTGQWCFIVHHEGTTHLALRMGDL